MFVRELYSEETLDRASERLADAPVNEIDELLRRSGIDPKTLARTAQKGMEEYADGLVDLRHGWKPKMMDGTPEEKREIYGELHATIKRMDGFSEPYVSTMRLITEAALRQLESISSASAARGHLQEALQYQGGRYKFDERNVAVTRTGGHEPATERRRPASMADAYDGIAEGFMHLKDLLNLLEDATTPEVYENVRNTNEFPEARIGQCFEAAHEIDSVMAQLTRDYRFLAKKSDLPREAKRNMERTLKLLKGTDRSKIAHGTQWYAALQFHEKPWDKVYKASIAATAAGVAGAAYSFRPFMESVPHYSLMFLASAAWTIISGAAIYSFTDAGPKTAKALRKLDEKVVRYRWV